MKLVCNTCGAIIQTQDVNIATDMAKCSNCDSLMRASELKEHVSLAELLVLPSGAKVQLQQGFNKSIELTAPKNGVTGEAVGLIIFSIFWLGFITVWTGFALFGGLTVMALFSIPFWLVGFFMVKAAINIIFESQRVTLTDKEVVIEQSRPVFSKTVSVLKSDITDVKYTDMVSAGPLASLAQGEFGSPNSRAHKVKNYPAIVTQAKTHFFFNNLPEADQRWVVRLLKNVLVGN